MVGNVFLLSGLWV